MEKIIEGYRRFRSEVYRKHEDFYRRLAAKKQQPKALFITCSDSRIDPNLLTQTEPGDLFIIRNAGNIIPPTGSAYGGTTASIEYAVCVLGVKHIIICGHSHCGAMGALLNVESLSGLPGVSSWLSYAESTRQIVQTNYADAPPERQELLAVYENVLVQLDHLKTHPSVKAAMSCGKLELHGWVYFIESGEVEVYDPEVGKFVPMAENGPPPGPAARGPSVVEALDTRSE